jgi:glycosyltransferase involved in cell wall biosynthesis
VNGDQRIRDREALHFATAARPDIHVWDRYLTTSEIHALTQLTDCYVSLHRSEGFGLTMAHAMAWGKPTIATAYSGNLAFMTPDNSFLVPYELTEVGSSAPPYPPTALWAEPDLDIAASLMRAVVDDPERAAAIGSAGARDIAAHRSASVAGAFVRAQFDRLHQR